MLTLFDEHIVTINFIKKKFQKQQAEFVGIGVLKVGKKH